MQRIRIHHAQSPPGSVATRRPSSNRPEDEDYAHYPPHHPDAAGVRDRKETGSVLDPISIDIYNVVMADLRFEWDARKNRANQRKHGISFEEARSVFFDPQAVEFYDAEHADREDRLLLLGVSAKLRILMVCHCIREGGDVIRLISARRAIRIEQRNYPWGVK